MTERSVILYIAMSLDGYIADRQGGVGWLEEVPGEGDNGYEEFYATVDTLIMGRTTYEQVLTFGEWPYAGKQCYVVSHHGSDDPNVECIAGDIPAFVRNLKQVKGGHIWLVGGADIVAQCMRDDLIDEYSIAIIPIILGDGISLFTPHHRKRQLRLHSVTRHGDITQLSYGT